MSLDAAGGAWNHASADGLRHVEFSSGRLEPFEMAGQDWLRRAGPAAHPLLRWYAVSGSGLPQTSARVPPAVADRRCRERYESVMRGWGAVHQLSVPVPLSGPPVDAIVLTRSDEDFSAEDLALAARLQPLLVALRRQADVLARWDRAHAGDSQASSLDGARDAVGALGLSPRELAVICLLSAGLTQEAIGRRLDVSVRTVHKHLENSYRKLGVGDRLSAVLRARALGILPIPQEQHPGPVVPLRVAAGRGAGRARAR